MYNIILNASSATSSSTGVAVLPVILLWLVIGLAIYFIPTVIAFSKKHNNKIAILMLNIFLGWTFVGWVIALVWSIKK